MTHVQFMILDKIKELAKEDLEDTDYMVGAAKRFVDTLPESTVMPTSVEWGDDSSIDIVWDVEECKFTVVSFSYDGTVSYRGTKYVIFEETVNGLTEKLSEDTLKELPQEDKSL